MTKWKKRQPIRVFLRALDNPLAAAATLGEAVRSPEMARHWLTQYAGIGAMAAHQLKNHELQTIIRDLIDQASALGESILSNADDRPSIFDDDSPEPARQAPPAKTPRGKPRP